MTIKKRSSLSLAIGAALMTTGAVQAAAADGDSIFATVALDGGYQLAAADKEHEGKCGEGKCGGDKSSEEGKCGEGKCGSDKSSEEGKCGEGKCGAGTDSQEDKSSHEGKCGEGKCGGAA